MRFRWIFSGAVFMTITGCSSAPPSLLPLTMDGKRHFNNGQNFLDTKDYTAAEHAFAQCIAVETRAYVPYIKLAAAQIGRRRFLEAAESFQTAFRLSGEPELAILSTIYQGRGGRTDDARRALQQWSGPDVSFTPYGAASARTKKLPGWFKTACKFLLGQTDETSMIGTAALHQKPYAYLYVMLHAIQSGDPPKAERYLQFTRTSSLHPSSWVHDILHVEADLLKR